MEQRVTVPIVGASVRQEGDEPLRRQEPGTGAQSERARLSINNVRMPRPKQEQVELVPQWEERNGRGQFKFRPKAAEAKQAPDAPAQPTVDGRQEQINNVLAAGVMRSLGIELPSEGPRMPDPSQYNFYDPQEEGQYHQALQEYVEATTQQKLQADRESYKDAIRQVELQKEFNAVVAEHGKDRDFQKVMEAALQVYGEVGADGKPLSLEDAYKAAGDPSNAKPGRPGNANLPKELRGGRRITDLKLGEIMMHNKLSGRARPFEKRRVR